MSLGPIMLGLSGTTIQAQEREMLLHPLTGGVVLFSRNYESTEQLTELVSEIHALREPHLLVAVDHEGGRVQRFRAGFTELPAIGQLGLVYDEDQKRAQTLSETSGWLMAAELRAVGIDFSFAPVLDLDRGISKVIGDRAFHKSPEVIAELAQHYIRGMHQAGMAAIIKHFPGHGSVSEDSHLAVPIDKRRFADIEAEDMLPFQRLSHVGVEGMMIAHVIYEQVDAKMAGFSKVWLQDILRQQYNFQGVIFSDDLEMAGAKIEGDIPQRVLSTLQAGCDMALVCQSEKAMSEALEGVSEWHVPASQLRLIRLHGRTSESRVQLQASKKWQQAVTSVQSYEVPHTLNLI